jgi:hypothetical protein
MKIFIFKFDGKLYKAQGTTVTSILTSMFTIKQLRILKFEAWEEM